MGPGSGNYHQSPGLEVGLSFPVHNWGLDPSSLFKSSVRSASLSDATTCLVMPDSSPVGVVSIVSPDFAQEAVEAQRLDHLPGATAELARGEPAVQILPIVPHGMRQPEVPVKHQ